jgi:prepilin-type N-terminal cleavage/methylation domain-containing protein
MIYLQGFTLLEVLISLMLFSLLLLGFEEMQIVSLQDTRAANYFYLASQQLHVITERLYLLSSENELPEQMFQWNKQNQAVLPAGRGILLGHYPNYKIMVNWGNFNKKCDMIYLGQTGCISKNIHL